MRLYNITKLTNPLYYVAPHRHTCYELLCYYAGEGKIVVNKTEYPIRPGSVFLIPPGADHEEICEGGFKNYFMSLDEPALNHKFFAVFDDHDGDIVTLLDILYREFCKKRSQSDNLCDRLTESILAFIRTLSPGGEPKNSLVERCEEILIQHFADPSFKVETGLQSLAVSPVHLRRLFFEAHKVTVKDYVTNLRLEQAKYHLRFNLGLSVKEIAYIVGYTDPYYFSRIFTRKVGCSPLSYRREQNSANYPKDQNLDISPT